MKLLTTTILATLLSTSSMASDVQNALCVSVTGAAPNVVPHWELFLPSGEVVNKKGKEFCSKTKEGKYHGTVTINGWSKKFDGVLSDNGNSGNATMKINVMNIVVQYP